MRDQMNKIITLCLGAAFTALVQVNLFPQAAEKPDFLSSCIDKSVDPGVDFCKYATGTWQKNNPIPASEKAWGIFNLVPEETYEKIKSILTEVQKKEWPAGSNKQKVGDFYFAGMDTVTIEKQGVSGLAAEFKMISDIKNTTDLMKVTAYLQTIGVGAMYGLGIDQDAKNSEQYALYVWQGGLGLPEREYYFRNDSRTQNIRTEYVKHVANILSLAGDTRESANKNAEVIFKIETSLADSSRKLEDLRDPYANYNKMTVDQLQKISPDINWNDILKICGINSIKEVIVGQPEFFAQLQNIINKYSIEDWKAYLKWHLVSSFSDRLSDAFVKERFNFRGRIMTGVTEQRPRWKRVQDAVEGSMGELLGQIYVEKYYSPKTKKRYEKLVEDMITSYRERIKKLDWMSEETKIKANKKLDAMVKKVGYPDKWKDFSSLEISRDSYLRNTINADLFWFKRDVNKLDKPVDRTEWNMTPQTYNAYYNPSNNEIVLPAAIFIVPGVPDSLVDDAVVYSYAGASTIGHEMTHGFDDQGRQYDEKGNLSNWWTKEDEDKFNEKTKLMVEQFDNYVVLDSMHVNGKATLGENIADLGGLVIGFDAFKKTEQYKEGKTIGGLTPSQRFWLGYAYAWLGHKRDAALAQQIMVDVHSPEFLRVNGPLSNIPDFYKAFNVKEGQPMYRPEEKRVKIW